MTVALSLRISECNLNILLIQKSKTNLFSGFLNFMNLTENVLKNNTQTPQEYIPPDHEISIPAILQVQNLPVWQDGHE